MTKDEFFAAITQEVMSYNSVVAADKGDWIVKGFIDIHKNVYALSVDTKVVSKILELLFIPPLTAFAQKNDLVMEIPSKQNHYPDFTFTSNKSGLRFAVDVKSTFKKSATTINGMTLGSYTGYFRNRTSTSKSKYAYGDYTGHYILGVIYSQNITKNNEKDVYSLDELDTIQSAIRDFTFFVQPKYKVASDIAGSGNTNNIGSVKDIALLCSGQGPFANLGERVFDDYWMYYLSNNMAKLINSKPPYSNLKTYWDYKQKDKDVLAQYQQEIQNLSEEESLNEDDTSEEAE